MGAGGEGVRVVGVGVIGCGCRKGLELWEWGYG